MNIAVPLVGGNSPAWTNIKFLTLQNLNSKDPGFSFYPNNAAISDILEELAYIHSIRTGKKIGGLLYFDPMETDLDFKGFADLSSLGLGLWTKIYLETHKTKKHSRFETVCLTGCLKETLGTEIIESDALFKPDTGYLREKLAAFSEYVQIRGDSSQRYAFLYFGKLSPPQLREGLNLPPHIEVKSLSGFQEALDFIFPSLPRPPEKTKRLPLLILGLCLSALLIPALLTPERTRKQPPQAAPPGTPFLQEIFNRDLIWKGGGPLLEASSYTPETRTLNLPRSNGYVWTECSPVNLEENPVLLFSIRSGGSRGLFLELKNSRNRIITGDKLHIVFNNTRKEFRNFCLNIADFIKEKDSTVIVIVFSDPRDDYTIDSITFTPENYVKAPELTFNGRQFIMDGKAVQTSNIIKLVNFQPGGAILYTHEESLILKESTGWIWGTVPAGVAPAPSLEVLNLEFRTGAPASFYLELKKKLEGKEVSLLEKDNSSRIPIRLPDTRGRRRSITLSLPVRQDRQQGTGFDIIALSDPRGTIEFFKISF